MGSFLEETLSGLLLELIYMLDRFYLHHKTIKKENKAGPFSSH
jgi:hypothetical protein